MIRALPLHILFLCSGVSGLIYQVVWVRQFGQVFGNTVPSASIVVAIFMLGLGTGSYLLGAVADRRATASPADLVRLYAGVEGLIAALGVVIALALPHLASVVATLSTYTVDSDGWQTLSTASYVWRALLALVVLGPITLLMGGTLTVLVRARLRTGLDESGWRVATLYGANTLGAALGALLTDVVLVPHVGVLTTQLFAASLNVVAGAGAFWLARGVAADRNVARAVDTTADPMVANADVTWSSLALMLSGCAALGMEIVWLRHLTVLLGGFRAVLSLLLTVMLLALGLGALLGGVLERRFKQPARTLIVVQSLFVVTTLVGLASNSADQVTTAGAAIAASLASPSGVAWLRELWFNLRPMLLEVAVPSLVGGLAFPLANAIVQRSQATVGRRAGLLYAANTAGAVAGSLITGFVLLPLLGMQGATTCLAALALLAIGPLSMVSSERRSARASAFVGVSAGVLGLAALAIWLTRPADFLIERAVSHVDQRERVVTRREGVTELLTVVEREGRGRGLLTNGHAMSSTAPLDQRYMRALAHIPLLSMTQPTRVLVIGFGVGNTTHAATLHPSVSRVDVADLSRNILDHASYFGDANHDVLQDRKVSVFVNDGRQHLQMMPASTYDLITLEPPPIAHAGVAALYSREFYELARSRLTAGGYVSQWLPAYQVPAEGSLAMVRAFVDAFPQSVLLSGAQAELLLIGTKAERLELDPDRVAAALKRDTPVREDLIRFDLGSVRELAGTFVGSAETLRRATSLSPAATDDFPIQEYVVRSGLTTGLMGVPASLFDVTQVGSWCARCLDSDAEDLGNLDLYLRLLQLAYAAPATDVARAAAARGAERVWGSAYLSAVLPDSAAVHNLLGLVHSRSGRVDAAIGEFEAALSRVPDDRSARANLGEIRYQQGASLMEARRFTDALPLLEMAVNLTPESAEAHNDLGVTLASIGRVGDARPHFARAVALKPDFDEARRNLQAADHVN